MTEILNIFAKIVNYAGIGMGMLVFGIIIIIFAAIKLGRLEKSDRSRTVAEFNRQFVSDTHSRISGVESGARRKDIALKLDIRRPR